MLQMEFVTELFILDVKEMDPSRAGSGTGSCETVDYHAGHDECDSGKAGDTGKAVPKNPRQSVRRKGDCVKTVQGNRSPARMAYCKASCRTPAGMWKILADSIPSSCGCQEDKKRLR